MPKPFPYKDSHRVLWKYDVTLISIQTGREEVCSNISSGLARHTRSGQCYTLEELEKMRKEIGKGTIEPVRNKVTTEEVEEFLKTIRKVHRKALLKVLKETHVPTSITESSFKGMVSFVLATNQVSFSDDELPLEGRDHTLAMHIVVKCEDMIVARVLIDNGSALNVYSMAALELLKVDMSIIKPSIMIIRAFNGTRYELQGEIELMIEISP
ncbi:hypothetical protein SO802_012437 [Lithocarpus litseifolius]|uniref:Uncharacterized protein n=1 Tax=Lithocarpus litseifolius TaxID=425828 RepID=A0AAW2D6P3_9ROSI